jgi:chromosome partitioning protein
MMVVAVISRKGGVGKSTIAVHLAVEAAKAGPVAVVDLDVQASAAGWGDSRAAEQPAVVTCPPARLTATLEAAKRSGAQVAIIDTAPHAEAPALAAARASDLMLIVTRPGILDLRAIGQSAEIAQLAGKPAAVVINAAPAVGTQASEASEAIGDTYGVEVCPIVVGQRVAFARALVTGQTAGEIEPDGKAAAEVTALWQWVLQRVGMSTRQGDEGQDDDEASHTEPEGRPERGGWALKAS